MEKIEHKIKEAKARLSPAKYRKAGARASASRLIIDLIAGVGLGCFLGWFLDKQLGTMPLFLFIFSICGMIGGWYSFYKDYIRQLNKIERGNKDA